MLKLAGAACILIAGTLFGFYQALHLARRPRQIRQLILALQRLETEILYGSTPLAEALRAAGRTLSAPLAELFLQAAGRMDEPDGASAHESWGNAITAGWRNTSMKNGERDTMHRLGATLGISDREDQIKHLRLAVSHLQAEEGTAEEERKRYESMWRSLGVLAAALVVLFMY